MLIFQMHPTSFSSPSWNPDGYVLAEQAAKSVVLYFGSVPPVDVFTSRLMLGVCPKCYTFSFAVLA